MVDTDLHYGQGYPSYPPPKRSHRTLWIALAVLVVAAVVAAVLLVAHRRHTPTSQTTTTTHSGSQPKQQPPASAPSSPNHTTTSTQNTHFSNVLETDDNPTGIKYQVTSGTEPVTGWFIVHVSATNSYGTFLQVAVLHQEGSEAEAVAGPDTSFPKSYLESQGVPAAVINQLPTYNE